MVERRERRERTRIEDIVFILAQLIFGILKKG